MKVDLYCKICGNPRGRHFNHEKCSRVLQKQKKGSGENKNPQKRMAKGGDKAADYIIKYFV